MNSTLKEVESTVTMYFEGALLAEEAMTKIGLTIHDARVTELAMAVPKELRELLENLDCEDANIVWEYLDGDPNALEEMIAVVADEETTKS